MKSVIKSVIIILLFFIASSCKKSYLDKAPDDDLTVDQVFANSQYAQNFLNNIYASLPIEHRWVDNDPNGDPFVGASDDLEQGYAPSFSNSMNSGAWNPSSYVVDPWTANYNGIRKANLFLENIDKVPLNDQFTQAQKNRLKGEAIFLRAYFHFLLIRVYGPVPIADHSSNVSDDFANIRRDPIDKCVSFITTECDKAAALLPPRITADGEYGRPAQSVCLALKARTLLYMASPLWNGNPDYANLKDDRGTRLFPDFLASRWQDAATAAKACIDEAEAAGYALYTSANNDPVNNYFETFYQNNNKELFFCFNAGLFNDHDVYSDPLSILGFTLNAPTQDLVDDYEMANGVRPITGYNADHTPIIDPASGYTETGFTTTDDPQGRWVAGTSNMYVNRDPRFYASIHFSGQPWKTRTGGLEFWFKGADGKEAAGSGNYSKTGYLVKKLCNPNFVWRPTTISFLRTWPLFRLGEQYLNYAEALNEAQGPVGDVYKYINLIRARSGMPGLPAGLSKDAMRERIHHERRIELAFEAHRYFDCHRWKIAEQTDNAYIYGLNIYAGTSKTDPAFFVRTPVEKRVFLKQHYLWPMQKRETDKNPHLVQNPGW